MKIHYLSDLHLEFSNKKFNNYSPPECDIVVIAGDIYPSDYIFKWISDTYYNIPVIFVAGNHEFYGNDMLVQYQIFKNKNQQYDNIHFLQNDNIVIDDVNFIGATLWTDFNLYGNARDDMRLVERSMNDYNYIFRNIGVVNNGEKKIPLYDNTIYGEDTLSQHHISVEYIIQELSTSIHNKNIVITHHLPSEKVIDKRYANSRINTGYASDLEYIIKDYQPNVWFFGHTHTTNNIIIENTKLLSNAFGYYNYQQNEFFNPNAIVEI